jgi:hypothetical protein
MKTENVEIGAALAKKLEILQEVPLRPMDGAAHGRERFLLEARILSAAVSENKKQRPKDDSLFKRITEVFQIRKERFTMSALSAILLVITLLVGGAGGTVYAAQDSLPNQVLYPVKIVSEDVRIQLAGDPQSRMTLLEEFSTRRVEELMALVTVGETPSEKVVLRLQDQLQTRLELAAGLSDDQLGPDLLRLREQLQTQDKLMERLQVEQGSKTMVVLNKAQTIIQVQLRTVEDGVGNMEVFRLHIRNNGDDQELEVHNSGDDDVIEPPLEVDDSIVSPEVQEPAGAIDKGNPEKQNTSNEPGDAYQGQGQENGQKPDDEKSGPKLTVTPSSNPGQEGNQNNGAPDDSGNGNSGAPDDTGNGNSGAPDDSGNGNSGNKK